MEGKPVTILVTGIGSPAAFGVVRSLQQVIGRQLRIIGADANPSAIGRVWVEKFYVLPPADSADFQQAVTEICKTESINVILPLVTRELVPLAMVQQDLSDIGTRVALSSPSILATANHKGLLFHALHQAGVPMPQFQLAETPAQLRTAFHSLGYPSCPVCFKPVYGDGSRGFRIIDRAYDAADSMFHKKPDPTYLSDTALFHSLQNKSQLPLLIVMEYLPGAEYSVDLLACHGEVLVSVVRLREEITGGITTKGLIVEEPDVTSYAEAVVRALGLHGNIGIQVRRSNNGDPRILEVNPRLQGTTVLCTAAGVNLPWLGVKLALGEEIAESELAFETGLRLVRYWQEIFFRPDGAAFTI